ncbi:MAG TPA: response regulator, partial [Gemmatimonadales bacterium]|nr:response regulator [Gemmatimonadales bacterium]
RTTGVAVEEAEAPAGDRPTLLVVEDNPDMRDWLASQLGELGTVIAAADGAEGLARARERIPDLIVTDARMGGLDGLELCRRLRADERTSHIPIIMASVLDSVDRRLEGIEAGADEYLGKPVEGRELRARVAALMAMRQALQERFRTQVIVRPSDVSSRPVDQVFFQQVMTTIEDRIGDAGFSVPELADAVAMSTSQLTRKLQALIRQSPGQLIRSIRLQRAAELIAAGAGTMAEIAYRVGFSDQSHLTRSFKQHTGKTPMEYRRESRGAATEP